MNNIICIDGLLASGKSSIARALGNIFGFNLLPSEIIYRFTASLVANELKHKPLNTDSVVKAVVQVLLIVQSFISNCNFKVTEFGALAEALGSISEVRELLIPIHRNFSKAPGLVAEGLDMGTVIFPESQFKFFLVSSLVVRWRRKCWQLGINPSGTYCDVLLFKEAKLFCSSDYYKIDTSYGDVERQLQLILNIINTSARLS